MVWVRMIPLILVVMMKGGGGRVHSNSGWSMKYISIYWNVVLAGKTNFGKFVSL